MPTFIAKIIHLGSWPFLVGIVYDSIGLDDALQLEKDSLEEEVWDAIYDLGKDKAPRLDGRWL